MLKIDNNLLNDVGLNGMPEADKQPFLAHIRQTLEMRVGTRLASKMSDAQLDEFERFIKGDIEFAKEFLTANKPGWDTDPKFSEQLEKAKAKNIPETAIITEYAALRWLEVNYPGYKQVVEEELTKLKHEIKQQAPAILSASQQPAVDPAAANPAADPAAQQVADAPATPAPQAPAADNPAPQATDDQQQPPQAA